MFGSDKTTQANRRIDNSEDAVLRLSDDIGKMADRIGDMAERIGDMSERILETQRIQAKNIELMQKSVMEAMAMMNEQMKVTNRIVQALVDKGLGMDLNPLD